MRRNIIILIFTQYVLCGLGQIRTDVPRAELDSLIQLIPKFRGTALVDHLNLVATSISQRYPDSCLYYANQALELSDSLQYEFGKAEAVFNVGNGYFFKLDVKNSMTNYLSAMQIFENLNLKETPKELGHLYFQIGIINRFIGNDLNAAKYYKKAGSIYKSLQLYRNIIQVRNELAYTFIQSKLYDSAFYYSGLNLIECKQLNYDDLLSKIYNNYGIIYLWRDDDRPENERFEGPLAIPYFDSSLFYANKFNDYYYKSSALINLAESYHHYMNPTKYSLGEKYYKLSIENAYLTKDWDDFVSSYALLGELYTDVGKLALSKVYLDSSLIAIEYFYKSIDTVVFREPHRKYYMVNYMYWLRSYAYRAFYKLYKSLGNYDSAFYYLQLKEKILDSLQQISTRNQIDYLLASSENENINKQIRILEQQKKLEQAKAQRSLYLLIGLALLFVITFLITTLLIRQNKLKTEQEKTALQQKLLRSQMNPHFIFNSLASIQNSIINEEPQKASKYLARFSKLVRNILDSTVEEFIPLEEELSTIENYLELQKIRFPEKFEYIIEVDEKIDPESVLIPPMLAQPFIENAIEHGIKHKESKGKIDVRFRLKNGSIELEVEDDGIGRQRAQEILLRQDKSHKSLATAITKERIRTLNKKLKRKISMAIFDLEDNEGKASGTKILIGIPIGS
ncbi:MAG: histidine kinase [Bacteroidales bacterium]|nr:histidine kinase [Bacteroidales bacterium]